MNKIIRFPTRISSEKSKSNDFDNEISNFFKKQKQQEVYRLIAIVSVLVLAVGLTILLPLWISFYLYEIAMHFFF